MTADGSGYRFRARLWPYEAQAAWHFLTLPNDVSDEIEEQTASTRRGFGSVRVEVTIGSTTWKTSVFPDTKAAAYVLPIKKQVRHAEDIIDDDVVEVALRVVE